MSNVKLQLWGSQYCQPCRMFKPLIQQIETTGYVDGGNITVDSVEYLDATVDTALAEAAGITTVPVLITLDVSDNELGRLEGLKPKTFIEENIKAAVDGLI